MVFFCRGKNLTKSRPFCYILTCLILSVYRRIMQMLSHHRLIKLRVNEPSHCAVQSRPVNSLLLCWCESGLLVLAKTSIGSCLVSQLYDAGGSFLQGYKRAKGLEMSETFFNLKNWNWRKIHSDHCMKTMQTPAQVCFQLFKWAPAEVDIWAGANKINNTSFSSTIHSKNLTQNLTIWILRAILKPVQGDG